MSGKIKILQSLNSLGMGGNVIFVMNFFRRIDKEKFQVDFLIYDDSKMNFYNEVTEAGSKVLVVKKKHKNKILQFFSQISQVKKLLKENDYDVIHCHSCSFIGIFRGAVPAFFNKNIKIISHAHNPGTPKNTTLDNIIRNVSKKFLSHITDMGFACSDESGASKYTSEFMNTPDYQVINNAIEADKFAYNPELRNKIREKYNMDDKFVIGSIGRLERQKNYPYMIDVLEEYVKINKDIRLFIVGEGSEREKIMSRAKEKGVEEYVILAGQTSTPELFYSAMDVFVLPSIYEGFGFVNIEAQISGLSCVVSEAVPREINISDKVKFLDFNPEKWCSALEDIRKNTDISQRKTLKTEKYDIKNECKRLEGFYTGIVSRKEG